ncbi:MAG: PAS domain-containing sensor histidine kinase [Isosphaeraceae bacterium]
MLQARWLCRLLETGPQPFAVVGVHQRVLSANRAFGELVGYSVDELVGMSILELTAEDSQDLTRQYHADILATGMNKRLMKKYRRKDGSVVPVELVVDVFRDDAGKPLGLYAFVTDISQSKETEAALVESERRARALFDGIDDAVFVHDQDGNILDTNPAACRQLGYTRDELIGLNTSQIDVPEFAAGFAERLKRQLQEGRLTCEGMHRTKGGKLIPVEVTSSTIHFGNQLAVLSIFRDITERKALERTRREFASAQMRNAQEMELKNRALSESESRYRRLAEASLDGIVVADGEGRVTLFNPAAEKIFGYESREILGRPLELLIPAAAPNDAKGSADQSMPLSPVVGKTVELTGRKRDGSEFPLELSLSAVEMDGQSQYIGSIRDQTERQRMRAMLAHTDKLASIGLLSAGVAHEINNPLAYVLNNLVVLQREVAGLVDLVKLYESTRPALERTEHETLRRIDELVDEIDWEYVRGNLGPMIERTQTGVKRVASIVEKMRGLARTSLPKWESVSLTDLVESALEMMRGRLKRQRIDVAVAIHDVIRIECVPDQIGQVLLNLLINALQAIESTGRQDGGRIEVEGRLSGPWVVISVRDNGPGIDPEHRERLFDPFFTTKPVGEGTGLGLAITHGIITGHGGRIELDSIPGQGCCFRIFLPQRPSSPPGPKSPFSTSRPA